MAGWIGCWVQNVDLSFISGLAGSGEWKTMKYVIILMTLLAMVFSASFTGASSWQGWRGSHGWGVNSPYQRLYKPETVMMIAGDVLSIEKRVLMKKMYFGIVLILKSQQETLPVHLGPVWYIERLDFEISKGDQLEIKGAKALLNNQPAIIAAEVKKGDRVLILRDNAGIPVWAGWGWKR